MKADDNSMTREERNRLHMERVRAVHRRSAYERTLDRIRYIQGEQARADAGLREPLRDYLLTDLQHLQSLRDVLLSEMVEAGQLDAN